MWKNAVERGRPQMAIWRIAHCMLYTWVHAVCVSTVCVGKNIGNCIQYFPTVVLFTVCTGCIVRCVVCIVVCCVVCIVVSCVVYCC